MEQQHFLILNIFIIFSIFILDLLKTYPPVEVDLERANGQVEQKSEPVEQSILNNTKSIHLTTGQSNEYVPLNSRKESTPPPPCSH